jgi:hypothetical protein
VKLITKDIRMLKVGVCRVEGEEGAVVAEGRRALDGQAQSSGFGQALLGKKKNGRQSMAREAEGFAQRTRGARKGDQSAR